MFLSRRCSDSSDDIHRYRNKISGPLLDRIDMRIEVPAVDTVLTDQRPAGVAQVRVERPHDLRRQFPIEIAIELGLPLIAGHASTFLHSMQLLAHQPAQRGTRSR